MPRYSCKVDWLSIVLPIVPVGEGSEENDIGTIIYSALCNEGGQSLADCIVADLNPLGYGRAPYDGGWQNKKNGIVIWGGGQVPHFTVEISGGGMDYIRKHDREEQVLAIGMQRASRIDVAVDLEQFVQPEEFLKLRKEGRQTSGATFSSIAGNTVYVGSRHSERYMRVYRYAAPHPRSHLLRLEVVFRRAYAKQVCMALHQEGLESVAKTALEDFGFGNLVDFDEKVPTIELSVYRPERNGGKTLRWLITQVAPAFKRLVEDGTIPNAADFLNRYFVPDDAGEDIADLSD